MHACARARAAAARPAGRGRYRSAHSPSYATCKYARVGARPLGGPRAHAARALIGSCAFEFRPGRAPVRGDAPARRGRGAAAPAQTDHIARRRLVGGSAGRTVGRGRFSRALSSPASRLQSPRPRPKRPLPAGCGHNRCMKLWQNDNGNVNRQQLPRPDQNTRAASSNERRRARRPTAAARTERSTRRAGSAGQGGGGRPRHQPGAGRARGAPRAARRARLASTPPATGPPPAPTAARRPAAGALGARGGRQPPCGLPPPPPPPPCGRARWRPRCARPSPPPALAQALPRTQPNAAAAAACRKAQVRAAGSAAPRGRAALRARSRPAAVQPSCAAQRAGRAPGPRATLRRQPLPAAARAAGPTQPRRRSPAEPPAPPTPAPARRPAMARTPRPRAPLAAGLLVAALLLAAAAPSTADDPPPTCDGAGIGVVGNDKVDNRDVCGPTYAFCKDDAPNADPGIGGGPACTIEGTTYNLQARVVSTDATTGVVWTFYFTVDGAPNAPVDVAQVAGGSVVVIMKGGNGYCAYNQSTGDSFGNKPLYAPTAPSPFNTARFTTPLDPKKGGGFTRKGLSHMSICWTPPPPMPTPPAAALTASSSFPGPGTGARTRTRGERERACALLACMQALRPHGTAAPLSTARAGAAPM